MLEDRGYDVFFSEGKVFLRHKTIRQAKNIWIHVNILYKSNVDGYTTLMGKAEKVASRDEGELWHKRLGHLHHGAFNVMHHISTGLPKATLA